MNRGPNSLAPMAKGAQKRKVDPARDREQVAAVAFVRELVSRYASQQEAAKALGLSASLISEALKPNPGRPVGPKLARAAAVLAGVSIDEVYGRLPVRQLYKPDRYPNLEVAVTTARVLLGEQFDEAVERARSIAMHFPTDRSVGEWVDELQSVARSIRRASKTGDAYTGRSLEDDDDTPPAGRD